MKGQRKDRDIVIHCFAAEATGPCLEFLGGSLVAVAVAVEIGGAEGGKDGDVGTVIEI